MFDGGQEASEALVAPKAKLYRMVAKSLNIVFISRKILD